ncbi:hypothetical protein BB561_001862 [Smittium simulii]|uniref:AP-2 complex subunit alpha n=1 Tax=Smittium simulii TaxID=133385 RepID=A0A2T9YSN5_9FUNG|nr:hypothetical protein BB561_001862 [Smittium simulii]
MAMRGLKTFITDLRNCKTDEEEQRRVNKELANIRSNFKDKKISGYSRKKYVSKLVFMNLAGYQVSFDQAVIEALVKSDKYSEKRIGYLALSIIIQENLNLSKNLYNAILADLTKSSEVGSCMALHAISLLENQKIATMVSSIIYDMILSKGVQFYQKKKASLCLSILIRRFPSIIKSNIWCEELIKLLTYPHLGVVTSIASVVLVLVQTKPEWCSSATEYSVRKLEKINITRDYPKDYLYHDVPAPWLQIKLLRILQYLEPTDDQKLLTQIEAVILNIYNNLSSQKKNLQNYNIVSALIIEAVNLSIHLGCLGTLIDKTVTVLNSFISSKDVNMQYLGLDTMGHLAVDYEDLKIFQKYKSVFFSALNYTDSSIQNRASDLLFTITTIETAKETVEKLVALLKRTQLGQRSDLLAKIAVLTEKYATEYTWYVDVMYDLILFSDGDIDNNIWKRAVQVIMANKELHVYAVRRSLLVIEPTADKNALKLSIYLIGELGSLISAEPECSPMIQLNKLELSTNKNDSEICGMAITAISKIVANFPEMGEDAIKFFNKIKKNYGIIIQQRINEYIAIIELKNPTLMQAVFSKTEISIGSGSSITKQLLKKSKSMGDRRTWVPETKILRHESKENLQLTSSNSKAQLNSSINSGMASSIAVEILESNYNQLLWQKFGYLYNNEEIKISVKLELLPPVAKLLFYVENTTNKPIDNFSINIQSDKNSNEESLPAEATTEDLCVIRDSDYDEHLYSGLKLLPGIKVERTFKFTCNRIFYNVPKLEISYACDYNGTLKTINFPVPLNFVQFIEPVKLSSQDFLSRWQQLQGSLYESQVIFVPDLSIVEKYNVLKLDNASFDKGSSTDDDELLSNIKAAESPFVDISDAEVLKSTKNNDESANIADYLSSVKKIFESVGLFEIKDLDSDPENYTGVGVATTNTAGRFGTLVRFELDSAKKMAQLTVRATSCDISVLFTKKFSSIFGK